MHKPAGFVGVPSRAPDLLSFASAYVHNQSINQWKCTAYQNCACAISKFCQVRPDELQICCHSPQPEYTINQSMKMCTIELCIRKPAGFVRCHQLSSRFVVIRLSLCTQSINQWKCIPGLRMRATSRFCRCNQLSSRSVVTICLSLCTQLINQC
jgi:hypothetical protein